MKKVIAYRKSIAATGCGRFFPNALIIALIITAAACSTDKKTGSVEGVNQLREFALQDVTLLDGPFRESLDINLEYLLSLEPDRFLSTFRMNAGLPSLADPYGGWEAPDIEIRGQSAGHYLSALAKKYAITGDQRLLKRGAYTVDELAKCQKALDSRGYLMAVPESFFDRLESGDYVWAPYYVFHKILAGMIDQYIYAGNSQALGVAEDMAAWVEYRTSKLSPEEIQAMLDTEYGGMADAFAILYTVTGNEKHLALAELFQHDIINVPLSLNKDALLGKHTNTQVPKLTAAARMYELTNDPYYKRIALNGYNYIVNGRIYSFGGFSNYEWILRPPHYLSDQLSVETAETCCTHNLLKLNHHLMTWFADPAYGDYYERALVNHILSSHDRETGMFGYYMPQRPGSWKIYSTPDSSFWCCVGSGMENPAEFGRSIYYHMDDKLYVNLFIASRLVWEEKGVELSQYTGFPASEGSLLELKMRRPRSFTLSVRVPWWTFGEFSVKVNGDPVESRMLPSSWLAIERRWRDGDRVEIEFPFSLHVERMADDPSLLSVMNGPLVLAADLGNEGISDEHIYLQNQRGMHRYRGPDIVIPQLLMDGRSIEECIVPAGGLSGVFRTDGAGSPEDFMLRPYYEFRRNRYQLYLRQADYTHMPQPWDFE